MIIKLVGMATILVSSSLIGFGCAERMSARERELSLLNDAIVLVRDELIYSHLAVRELVFRVAPRLAGCARDIFDTMCEYIRKGAGVPQSWENALEENSSSCALGKNDVEILKNSSFLFESYDFDEQEKALAQLADRIERCRNKAMVFKEKNSKIVKMLGVYCGILLCIIIF